MEILKGKGIKILFIFSLLIFLGLLFLNIDLSKKTSQQKVEKFEVVSPTPLPEQCNRREEVTIEGTKVYRQVGGLRTPLALEGLVKEIGEEKMVISPMGGGEEEEEILRENILSVRMVKPGEKEQGYTLPGPQEILWEEIKAGDHVSFTFQPRNAEKGSLLIIRE